ncbi:MAG TPA: DUF397 domain-containing protein [Streptosporangiaceae bacterium]|jgi:hypothetical protein
MTPIWRKSSHSGGGQGGQSDCVEAARFIGAVGIRDSKNRDAGALSVSGADFAALLLKIKRGELNR